MRALPAKQEVNIMGMTMSQKILASHAGLESVEAGQLIEAKLDLVLGNDITSPVAIHEMDKMTVKDVFDKDKIALVMDHFIPNKDIKSAENCKCVREFAKAHDVTNYYDVGEMGIEHALLPEKGLVVAGDLVIGADSHTCTYGALGAFSTGVGSTDMAAGMATGRAWFKVPAAIRVNVTGKFRPYVSGKDVILHLIGEIGVDGALYKSLEFVGDGISELSMDDRFTIANMAIEAGAKNGIFPVDDKAMAYMKEHSMKTPVIYEADPDAEYEREVTIDLGVLESTVSYPHLPENTHPMSEIRKAEPIAIDQVVIGSCTNGRISDLRQAAEILKGRKVKKGLRCIVIPATQAIYLQALGRPVESTLISLVREVVLGVALPILMPLALGLDGLLGSLEVAHLVLHLCQLIRGLGAILAARILGQGPEGGLGILGVAHLGQRQAAVQRHFLLLVGGKAAAVEQGTGDQAHLVPVAHLLGNAQRAQLGQRAVVVAGGTLGKLFVALKGLFGLALTEQDIAAHGQGILGVGSVASALQGFVDGGHRLIVVALAVVVTGDIVLRLGGVGASGIVLEVLLHLVDAGLGVDGGLLCGFKGEAFYLAHVDLGGIGHTAQEFAELAQLAAVGIDELHVLGCCLGLVARGVLPDDLLVGVDGRILIVHGLIDQGGLEQTLAGFNALGVALEQVGIGDLGFGVFA